MNLRGVPPCASAIADRQDYTADDGKRGKEPPSYTTVSRCPLKASTPRVSRRSEWYARSSGAARTARSPGAISNTDRREWSFLPEHSSSWCVSEITRTFLRRSPSNRRGRVDRDAPPPLNGGGVPMCPGTAGRPPVTAASVMRVSIDLASGRLLRPGTPRSRTLAFRRRFVAEADQHGSVSRIATRDTAATSRNMPIASCRRAQRPGDGGLVGDTMADDHGCPRRRPP